MQRLIEGECSMNSRKLTAASTVVAFATAAALMATAVPATAGPWDGVRSWETATVKRVVDGDTLIVNDEVTGVESRIRLLGINAPEVTTSAHAGQCGGALGRKTMKSLVPVGTRVRLAAVDQTSKGKSARPQRVVLAFNPATGEFDQDLAWAMAERGLGVWFTVAKEAAMSSLYREAIAGAQSRGVGIWNPNLCRQALQPEAVLSLRIGRTAPGGKVADEWVSVRNTGASTVDISGWMLRDSGLQGWYTFPGGSILTPGDYRVVHTGSGTPGLPDGHDVYAGAKARLYQDVGTGPALVGDGAYLLDAAKNFRFWREYPCTATCDGDPLAASLVIDAVSVGQGKGAARAATQWVRLANKGATEACLDGVRLDTGAKVYRFAPGTCIPAGGIWTLNVRKGAATPTEAYWGLTEPALWASGTARLISDRDQVIATGSW
jgi:endonuclease YncB( thermonuclease family)